MADQPVTREKLINADIDVDNLGKASNELGVVNPRYGNPYKTAPQVIKDIEESGIAAVAAFNAKADQVVAQGFYKGYTTEALLLAAKPAVAEMRARADDTRKIYRWNRTSAEGATPVTGTWTDTGLSDKDLAIAAAATDATTKANTAESNAKTYTDKKTPAEHISKDSVFNIVDENGDEVFGVYGDGTIKAPIVEDKEGVILSSLQPKESISPFAYSITDENGNPLLKIKSDGTLVVESVEDANGIVGSSGVPLDKIFNNVSQLDIYINHGQSNGSGGVPTTPPVTNTQEYNNWLLNGGIVSDLVIASDKPETPGYNMVNHLTYMTLRDTSLDLGELSSRNGVFSIAESGTGIVALYSPDRGSFRNFTDWLTKIKSYCDANGITCNVKAMIFTHGEFDAATMPVDEYLGHQYALYNAFNDKAREITGQKNDMKFLTWQLGPNNAGEAQIKAARQHSNIVVAFPKYCGFFGDGTHLDAIGTAFVGAYYAKAYRYHFEQGKCWQPLMHTSCEKYGTNAVKVKFNRTGLTFDSSRFSANSGGFYGTDASGALTVSSYIVDQNDNVVVTFNRDIVGDLTFGYGVRLTRTDAGQLNGGTLRDNEGLFEKTLINGTEYPLHNWALTFEEVVK